MYPVDPVRNIATLLRLSRSLRFRHSLGKLASIENCAPAAPRADGLQSKDMSIYAMREYERRSNIPTSQSNACRSRNRPSPPAPRRRQFFHIIGNKVVLVVEDEWFEQANQFFHSLQVAFGPRQRQLP